MVRGGDRATVVDMTDGAALKEATLKEATNAVALVLKSAERRSAKERRDRRGGTEAVARQLQWW